MYLLPHDFSMNLKFLVPIIPMFKVVFVIGFQVKDAILRNVVYADPDELLPTSNVIFVEKLSSIL